MSSIDWTSISQALSDDECRKIDGWRGYPDGFMRVVRDRGLVGMYQQKVAFPVAGDTGEIRSIHYRRDDGGWQYHPPGQGTKPLIIGNLDDANEIYVFESQWDALAFLSAYDWHLDQQGFKNIALIITRGAQNGQHVSGLIRENQSVTAVMQNDPPREGKLSAAEKWSQEIKATVGRPIVVVRPPAVHKDLNEWLKAGATAADINAALQAAINDGSQPEVASVVALDAKVEPKVQAAAMFPIEDLPGRLGETVQAVAEQYRVPIALTASVGLGLVSGCLGKGLAVQGRNWITRGNLYILATAETGSGKSTVFDAMSAPLVDFQKVASSHWQDEEEPRVKAELLGIKKQIEQLLKPNGATIPANLAKLMKRQTQLEAMAAPCYVVQDVTSERLASLMLQNNEVAFSASAETRKIVDNLFGRYSSLKRTDEGIYLQGYTGDFTRIDRQSRGPTVLHSPCLALLWLIHPDNETRLFGEEALRSGGLLPRFLFCRTNAERQHIDLANNRGNRWDPTAWRELLVALLNAFLKAPETQVFQPSEAAERCLLEYHNELVDRHRSELADVGSFTSRWAEQAWRLAVVLHAATYGSGALAHELDYQTADSAVRIQRWFSEQQLSVLNAGRLQEHDNYTDKIMRLLRANTLKQQPFVTARDVYRAGVARDSSSAERLLQQMEAGGMLSHEDLKPTGGGKTSRHYVLVQDDSRPEVAAAS